MKRPIFASVAVALLIASPAFAQFGGIFSDPPPRPPGDVGRRGVPPPPNFPTGNDMPTQEEVDDEPPPQQPPARTQQRAPQQQFQTLQTPQAPQQAPIRGGIDAVQSQPLPPPPGTTAPPAQQQAPGAPNQQAAPNPAGAPQRGGPAQPANTAPQPGDEIVVQPPEQKIINPTAVFSGLDKITGRTISFDVAVNETVQFGALQVTPRVCYTRPPTETPNTDAFLSVDEVTLQGEVRRIFTGWMYAASPGLHAVEHPVYDVWLTGCKGGTPAVAEAPAAEAGKPPAPTRTNARPQSPAQGAQQGAQQGGQPVPQPPQQQRRTQSQPQPAAPNFLNPFR